MSKPAPYPGLWQDNTPSAGALVRWAPSDWLADGGWQPLLADFFASAAGQQLGAFVTSRLASGAVVYPAAPLRALALTPLSEVRVVILGQDPYHGPGQAEGLAFSVVPSERVPPSLRNVFQELARDLGLSPAANGALVRWAVQGVLLLNTCLTVEDGHPASHAKKGWEVLTDRLIQHVATTVPHAVFMLWGAHAQAKQPLIVAAAGDVSRHLVLRANHPSPLSARRPPLPFIGCGHFSAANVFLQAHGLAAVNW